MTAGMEMLVARGQGSRPDLSVVEESCQALSRIDSGLARKLKAIAALSAPAGMDDAKWQASKETLEAQAENDAEKEKLPHKTVIQLYELHQIYDGLVNDGKTVSQCPKNNIVLSEQKKSPVQEAEKRIAAALIEVSRTHAATVLHLGGLSLESVPESVQKLSSTLVKLDLSNNNLETLPEAVTNFANLINLDLHSNQITSLPDSIGNLVKLKVLNVSGNMLTALPEGIEGCRALEDLIADFNQLTRLPEALGYELLNLRTLSVNSNRLTRLPYSTSHMMRLRVLDAHQNRLGALPEDLENLTNLEVLNLSKNFNYLVSLPESIGGLTSLVEIDISYNHITALPNSIAHLDNLQSLKVEGNPLVVPPRHVVEHSLMAIKQYMGERLKVSECKTEKKRHSWLGQLLRGKWGRRGTQNEIKHSSKVLSMQEECYCTPRANMLSPLRMFTPGHSSSPFRAFATPLRTQRHSYEAI